MLKYLLGIVTALIFVAALVVWTSMPTTNGTGPAGGGGTDGAAAPPAAGNSGSDGASLFPKPGGGGETRGLTLGGDGAAAAPMHRQDIAQLGFGMDIPQAWLKLDAIGMRRYFSEFQGMTDQQQVNALVSTIVLATIRDWPGDGAVANVIVNHRLAPKRDELAILNTMLDQKRSALDNLEVTQPPTVGQLGPFWGASVRTREVAGTGDQAATTQAIVWILRIADGYMLISAEAPAGDAEGLALIERILGSVSAVRKPG